MPLDKEHKCIYKVNADIKCEYSNCKSCSHYPNKEKKEMEMKFYYVWFEDDDTGLCNYIYFNSLDKVKEFFNKVPFKDKTYGIARFIDGMLEPHEVIGTTL